MLEEVVVLLAKNISKGVTQGLLTDATATRAATATIASDLLIAGLRGELDTHEEQPAGETVHPATHTHTEDGCHTHADHA